MLPECKLIAFVPTEDATKSIPFYRDTLGLPLVSEDPFAVVFNAHGNMLRLVKVQHRVAVPYTILGWEVPDIVAAVEQLSLNGVTFERFEGLNQDKAGIWSAPGGAKAAWFKDPDSNVLSISQH